MEAEAIARTLKEMTGKVHSSFILDTLEFMRAGGRCSAVVAFGANALGLKPCIEVQNRDGSMAVGKKYRGKLGKVLVNYVKDRLKMYRTLTKADCLSLIPASIRSTFPGRKDGERNHGI